MKSKGLIILLSLIATSINAQDFNHSKMDSLFSIIESNSKGMGSISIFQNDKEVYQKSYGYANLETKKKADAETKYRIGSISKTFTATIIMKLIESNKLSLDDKLNKFYPEIKNATKITIEDLLRHRSGIFNITSSPDFLQWNTTKLSKKELLKKIASAASVFEPNTKFEYSNSNYILLTFIAEDAGKKAYAALLNEFIVKPCNLKNTLVGEKINSAKNEANSYKKADGWVLESETDMSIPLGAGSIVSTPTELNTFFNALFNNKIVKKESLEIMKTLKENFGIGLFQIPFYDIKGYGHTGGLDGFQSSAAYFPEKNMSIACTTNAAAYPINEIMIGALSIYFGRDYELPDFSKTIELQSQDLDKYLGVYSAPDFPLKVTITKTGNILMGQATGQPSFALECFDKDKFKFDQAMLKLEFIPNENKMFLKQGGGIFELKRE